MKFLISLLLLIPTLGLATDKCDLNAMTKKAYSEIRHEEEVLPYKIENIKAGLIPFNFPPANVDFSLVVTFKRTNLKTNEVLDMSGILYFDSKCELVGYMARSIFPEGDPRIIEFK